MGNINDRQHRSRLQQIARRAMLARGLLPDFSAQAIAELDEIHSNISKAEEAIRDLRNLLWCSIDNDDSNDLDQLTVAEEIPGGAVKILVAIADVFHSICKGPPAFDDAVF